jgi:hypothetical protein
MRILTLSVIIGIIGSASLALAAANNEQAAFHYVQSEKELRELESEITQRLTALDQKECKGSCYYATKFQTAQRAWREWVDQEAQYTDGNFRFMNGTAPSNGIAGFKLEATQKRIGKLKQDLQKMKQAK